MEVSSWLVAWVLGQAAGFGPGSGICMMGNQALVLPQMCGDVPLGSELGKGYLPAAASLVPGVCLGCFRWDEGRPWETSGSFIYQNA